MVQSLPFTIVIWDFYAFWVVLKRKMWEEPPWWYAIPSFLPLMRIPCFMTPSTMPCERGCNWNSTLTFILITLSSSMKPAFQSPRPVFNVFNSMP
ncbi:hypothetical protein TNCT_518881 [Trichonephila clavata]|uniref:Uncharacterized protein n=1 Tax=Trichonephila clavata TaxID=2740835 RepID=A0A8X6GWB9_TRICU|nr:hypothetical protein TNCT_518881 [Trichonephila clavata]